MTQPYPIHEFSKIIEALKAEYIKLNESGGSNKSTADDRIIVGGRLSLLSLPTSFTDWKDFLGKILTPEEVSSGFAARGDLWFFQFSAIKACSENKSKSSFPEALRFLSEVRKEWGHSVQFQLEELAARQTEADTDEDRYSCIIRRMEIDSLSESFLTRIDRELEHFERCLRVATLPEVRTDPPAGISLEDYEEKAFRKRLIDRYLDLWKKNEKRPSERSVAAALAMSESTLQRKRGRYGIPWPPM
jgi:hypothetical protein